MTAFAESAAAWLLTYALHSTVLLGLAWLVVRIRRAEPATAEILWKVALIGGVVTASLQSALDLRPAGTIALARSTLTAPSTAAPTSDLELSPQASMAERKALGVDRTATPTPSNEAVGGSDPSRASIAPSFPMVALLAIGWFVVALLLIAWYAGRRLVLVGRLGDRRAVSDGPLRGVLDQLRLEVGFRDRVILTATTAISSPVALGRREICVPAAAEHDLESDQQRAMLAHELAHLVRRDPFWLAFACVMERLFFFQPLNRLARRGIQESAEYLADEWAANHSGGVPLARCLVKVAEWIQASPLGVPVAGMAEQRSQLSARVSRLLAGSSRISPLRQRAMGMLSVGALATMAAFAPGVARRAVEPESTVILPTEAITSMPSGDTIPHNRNRN